MTRVLILKTGGAEPAITDGVGDYDDWFRQALPGPADRVRLHAGEPLPDPSPYAGLLITGSPLSVRDELPWMRALGEWALDRARQGQPVLGVCFGHQLLGEALGGRVERNPAGPERGLTPVQLTPEGLEDPLFEGLGPVAQVHQLHADALVVPPPGATRLAGTANTPWQAFAWGPALRAVQFHPEVGEVQMNAIASARGWDCPRGPAEGRRVLENWWRGWVSAGR